MSQIYNTIKCFVKLFLINYGLFIFDLKSMKFYILNNNVHIQTLNTREC